MTLTSSLRCCCALALQVLMGLMLSYMLLHEASLE